MSTSLLEAPHSTSDNERRIAPRAELNGWIWLVDSVGRPVTRAEFRDVSATGMRLRVPLGFGLAEGQQYELHATPPTDRSGAFGLRTRRWARIVRTCIHADTRDGEIELGVTFDTRPAMSRAGVRWPS
ncbi:MAG: hypothetical protein SF069_18010 [Phycisphaerae bacterium]|nr:hypothetical protein [Phycisphaerae bacterium]